MVKMLLRKGANPFQRDHENLTPREAVHDETECTAFMEQFEERLMNFRNRRRRTLAIMSALHSRLGEKSLLALLDPDLLQKMVEMEEFGRAGNSDPMIPDDSDLMSLVELTDEVRCVMHELDEEEKTAE